eukprot:573394-Rhodomonas_salina.1
MHGGFWSSFPQEHRALAAQRACRAFRAGELRKLLDHMENTCEHDACDTKTYLDWDACGISHETGEFMWGND